MLAHRNHVSNNILASCGYENIQHQTNMTIRAIQSGMSWIADDALSSYNLIGHLGTTIRHTLGLYTTPHSQ